MNGSQFAFAVTFFSGVFVIICVYFDRQRHKDPFFRKKLLLKRSKSKILEKREREVDLLCNVENEADEKEIIILREIGMAEKLMVKENFEKAVVHFANAIAVCVDPCNLLIALRQSLPSHVFELLVDVLVTNYGGQIARFYEDRRMKAILRNRDRWLIESVKDLVGRNTAFHNNSLSREKSSTRTSISEPELTTGEKSPFHTGFPPGVTVDELHRYRKKTFPAFLQLHDNIKLEEGSFQKIKSEYTRRYHENPHVVRTPPCRPEDAFKVEGRLEFNPEYYESFIEYPIQKSIVRRPKNLINGLGMEIADEDDKTDGEQDEEDNPIEPKLHRHYLFKPPTNLKLEGDFYSATENAEKFINYLLTGRPDLARVPTTLKLEGDMETKTETRDKYVPLDYQTRPPLFKKSTNLHLEGILDITTETREKYLPYEAQQRPPLTKRGTNLHLEGDLTLQPEYRDVFVEYKEAERPRPKLPVNNLKPEGCLGTQTEKSEKFVEHQIHPIIPFLRGSDPNKTLTLGSDAGVKRPEYREKFVAYSGAGRSLQHRPKPNLKPEGDMEIITESKIQFVEKPVSKTEMRKATNNLLLEGSIDMNPEYRNAYVNFYRDAYGKFGVRKDENEPEKRRRRTVSHPAANLKTEGAMETNPEYKSSFVDFPRQRPSVKKPAGHLHSEGKLSQVTEKRAQYVAHPKGSKSHPLKRQTELKLEGPFECQPEYRRAYIDYITREKVELLRPLDNLGADSRRVFDGPATPPLLDETAGNATAPAGDGSAALPAEAKSTLPLPVIPESLSPNTVAPRKASLSPVPKASGRRVNKENLAKIENSVFGPKVPNPSRRSRSRNITFAPEKGKKLSEADRLRALRARRHYGSPIMVENLAYTPRTSPVQAILKASARYRWKDEEDNREKEGQAFVVLSSVIEDRNQPSKSNANEKHCDRNHVGYSQLYKEQKWMPSWYANSSKE